MRVLVCGGRNFTDYQFVEEVLTHLHWETPITLVIQGGAKGADYLGRLWAQANRVPIQTFPANWDKHGRAAGAIRNSRMAEEGKPDLVVAFPGGAGTANMVAKAKKQNIKTLEVPHG